MATANKAHAGILASPGMGHLIPTVELGKRLLNHHGFYVTIFVVTTTELSAQTQLLQQHTSNDGEATLNVVVLPQVDISKFGPIPSLGYRVSLSMMESLPSLGSFILSMKDPPSLLIVDLFGTLAIPMARDLGMATYLFFTSNAWFTAVTIYLPQIDPKHMDNTHVKNRQPLCIPGCNPIRFEDTMESFLVPGGPSYQGYLDAAKQVVAADGILVNTWQDLEPSATKAVLEGGILAGFARGRVYTVGPLVRTESVAESGSEVVMEWLDRQPDESVIYVSFGSGGTISEGQMRELALGLEMSQQRFVWVVRPPVQYDSSGAFFGAARGGEEERPEHYLPEGFAARTREVGLVVPMWAPQTGILGHRATGGFVTHCGWNSVLEGIFGGVAMVAWPLYAEQMMNATMMSEKLGVAVRVSAGEGGVVGREEIAGLVRRVMVDEEGCVMRAKVKELKLSGDNAVSESGSSHESLCEMAKECQVHLQESEAKARGA